MSNWKSRSESRKECFSGLKMRAKELEEHEDVIKSMPLIESATRQFNAYVEQSEELEIFNNHVANRIEEYQELKQLYQSSEPFQQYIGLMDLISGNPIRDILYFEMQGFSYTKIRIVQDPDRINRMKRINETEDQKVKLQNKIEDLGLAHASLPLE